MAFGSGAVAMSISHEGAQKWRRSLRSEPTLSRIIAAMGRYVTKSSIRVSLHLSY